MPRPKDTPLDIDLENRTDPRFYDEKAKANETYGNPKDQLRKVSGAGAGSLDRVQRNRKRRKRSGKGDKETVRQLAERMVSRAGAPHPLEGLARLANEGLENGDYVLSFQCFKELAAYMVPKYKATEYKETGKSESKPIQIVLPPSNEGKETTEGGKG